MAVLCRKIRAHRPASHSEGEEDAENIIRQGIDGIMLLASRSHARLEKGTYSARMVSVHEIVQECNINLKKLTIELEELFIVHPSSSSCELSASPPGHPMKYRASSCFLQHIGQLPLCMETCAEDDGDGDGDAVAAIATSNSHTVCIVCSNNSSRSSGCEFAFFDPLPGVLCMGLSQSEVLEKLCESLRLPSTCSRLVDETTNACHNNNKSRRHKNNDASVIDLLNSAAAAAAVSALTPSVLQQCDVSLMYRMKKTKS
jgi:hypothetical protein